MNRVDATRRPGRRGASRRQRGSAMVEFAIVTPILLVLIFWSNYFFEVQVARVKGAEAARFMAFERTVRKDLNGIKAEAQDRYQDLNGITKGVTAPVGFTNRYTLTTAVKDAPAPLAGSMSDTASKGGVSGAISKVISAIGSGVGAVLDLFDFDTSKGAVQADVTITVENRIIPRRIIEYNSGFDDTRLNIVMRDSYFVYHDTWRAWDNGYNPNNSYPLVENLTAQRANKITYLGLDRIPGLDQALELIGAVLGLLKIDFPLKDDYKRQSVVIKGVKEEGRRWRDGGAVPNSTRTVPGDVLQGVVWLGDGQNNYCYRCNGRFSGGDKLDIKRGLRSTGGWEDNWPMRAYNCRGKFFQGATRSELPESDYAQSQSVGERYFRYGDSACEN